MKRIPRKALYSLIAVAGVVLCARIAFRQLPLEYRGKPLIYAAREGSVLGAGMALVLGSEVDDPDNTGTALHAAAERGDSAMVGFLLRYGANPDVKAKFGVTPLLSGAGVSPRGGGAAAAVARGERGHECDKPAVSRGIRRGRVALFCGDFWRPPDAG